jgi:two-component system, sensor histidine kinase ChiS
MSSRVTFILPMLALMASCANTAIPISAKEGFVNLEFLTPTSTKVYELNGMWEYYPNAILSPTDIASAPGEKRYVPLPGSFSRYADLQSRLPEKASATYRLMAKLPLTPQVYSIRFPAPLTASRLFVNGHLEIENGRPAVDLVGVLPDTRMRYRELPLVGDTEIVIQVSNRDYHKGGVAKPISIGTAPAMSDHRLSRLLLDILVVVALLTFAIYHLILWFLKHPENSSVYYGLFCLMVAGGRLVGGERIFQELFPSLTWTQILRVDLFANFLDASFFALYARHFFPKERKSKLLAILAIGSAIFGILAVVSPVSFASKLREPFQVFIAITIPFGIYKVARLVYHKEYGGLVFMSGLILIAVAFLNDALIRAEIIRTPPIFSYSILIFTFMQAILISGKSVAIFRHNAELSQKLVNSEKIRDEFLTQASHELRTPVQAMVQMVENLRRGVSGAINEQIQRMLTAIEENGRRLVYLIDDMTDFIHLKRTGIKLNIQTLPLQTVISPVLKLCLGLSQNRNLVLVSEIPEELPNVTVDPIRIQQMLLNLLNTALRYAHSDVIVIRVGIIDQLMAISVFYHGEDPDARYTLAADMQSDDMGPQVTVSLAKLMGGKYIYKKYAQSQHEMSIAVPYDDIAQLEALLKEKIQRTEYRNTDASKISNNSPKMQESVLHNDAQIMIVGDNASQNRLLQEQLVSLNKTIIQAKNGAEAMLRLQERHDIGLVICDVLLSDVSGIELAMNMRVHYDIGLLPIILIIDNNQSGIAASAFSAGANDLVRRPFEKAEVLARVKNVLLQREASLARENYRALDRELEIARSIQESIIPVSQPKSNLYSIEAICMPARSIGGDFYDFIEDETSVAILIADVAGHGIPAALYASMLKIAFHNLRDQARFPEKLLKELNDMMVDRGERTFISCAYTYVDFKNKRLLHANAGHLPLLLQEPGKKRVEKVQPPGGVLGVRKSAAITVEMHHLQPKTRLVLFTDGVIELVNRHGEFFEEERLVQILEEMRDDSLKDVKERLLADMRKFADGEPFLDDVTFVLIDV